MNKKNIKNWFKYLEDDMVAAAFAEAGEFETAREILKEDRKILLALTGENSDLNAFRYAINMCKRISAKLEILCEEHYSEYTLAQFTAELEKEAIGYDVTKVMECVKEEVLNFTSERRDILFVVVESSDGLNLNCKKTTKVIENSWKSLKCPLVLVSDPASA